MNRARDAGEVLQHLDEHSMPVGLTDEEFRDTGGGLGHGRRGYMHHIIRPP
jgi:hypothetical protein